MHRFVDWMTLVWFLFRQWFVFVVTFNITVKLKTLGISLIKQPIFTHNMRPSDSYCGFSYKTEGSAGVFVSVFFLLFRYKITQKQLLFMFYSHILNAVLHSSCFTTNASQNRLTLRVKINTRIVCAEVGNRQSLRHGTKCQSSKSKLCKHVRLDISTVRVRMKWFERILNQSIE